MNADTATPTTPPTPLPGGSLPVVPAPGATTPPVNHDHVKDEPNALLEGLKALWANVKAGKVGSPRVLALVIAVVAIIAAWWFLSHASLKNDSALWLGFDSANQSDGIKTFVVESSQKNTVAAKVAALNDLRLRRDAALFNMTNNKKAERLAAANTLASLREEFVTAAGQLDKDLTLKAKALSEAAEIELALIGVPKEGVTAMGVDVKGNCRGQVEKYSELLKKAAEAIGPNTDAGKALTAEADKYSGAAANNLYEQLGRFHARFNDADLVPFNPADPNGPKAPDTIGGGTPKPGDTTAPKPPEGNPFDKK